VFCSLRNLLLLVKLQVEIKRTIPKGAAPLKDFKTKKIFVGGLPSALKEGIMCFIIFMLPASMLLTEIVNVNLIDRSIQGVLFKVWEGDGT
jgi:hypothetical protein